MRNSICPWKLNQSNSGNVLKLFREKKKKYIKYIDKWQPNSILLKSWNPRYWDGAHWCENAVVTARRIALGNGSNWAELPVSLHWNRALHSYPSFLRLGIPCLYGRKQRKRLYNAVDNSASSHSASSLFPTLAKEFRAAGKGQFCISSVRNVYCNINNSACSP